MQVRRIRAEEWQRYRDIRLAALLDAPDAFGSTWRREAAFPETTWRERAGRAAAGEEIAVFVAVDGDAGWLGLAGGLRPGEPPADAELVSMWVSPAARGRGVGRRLVDAVLGWTAGHGAHTVGLWVTRGNAPAVALYERCGFGLTGDAQPLPSDPGRDELRMLRVPT